MRMMRAGGAALERQERGREGEETTSPTHRNNTLQQLLLLPRVHDRLLDPQGRPRVQAGPSRSLASRRRSRCTHRGAPPPNKPRQEDGDAEPGRHEVRIHQTRAQAYPEAGNSRRVARAPGLPGGPFRVLEMADEE